MVPSHTVGRSVTVLVSLKMFVYHTTPGTTSLDAGTNSSCHARLMYSFSIAACTAVASHNALAHFAYSRRLPIGGISAGSRICCYARTC